MMRDSGQLVDFGLRQILPDTLDYPSALRRCFNDGHPPTVTSKGDLGVLDRPLIGLFCSVRCPGDIILKTYDLARALRTADVTVAGGFQSPMEKECLSLLLRGTIAVVVCPARGLVRIRVAAEWKKPLADRRFLLLSFFERSIRRATTEIAAKRNAFVVALADRILIAHAEEGGKTEKMVKDALICGKPVFVLDSPDNAHLSRLGAIPVPADDPTVLL